MKDNTPKCAFSTGIDDSLTCSQDGDFDAFGFPEEKCSYFPCEKYKKLVKELGEGAVHPFLVESGTITDEQEA